MKYLIGLDVGTSSVKGVLMSCDGKKLECKTKKHIYYEENGIKTLCAEEFCKSCFAVLKELSQCVLPTDEICGICPSGASGNLVLIKEGKAISPIFGWQTQFDKEIVDSVLATIEPDYIYKTVGWQKNYGFPLATLAYLKATDYKPLEECDKVCMHIEYLNYVLTGSWGITPSMATPFYLVNQEEGDYDKIILDTLKIKKEMLPPIVKNCTPLGKITKTAAGLCGIKEGTPVVAGTFDHPSAARGAGVFDEDEVLVSCGTSWVVFIPFSKRSMPQEKKMLTDPFMSPEGNFCGMKSLTSVSDTIDRYIKKYLGNISFEELDSLSDKAPVGANGLLIDDNTNTEGFEKTDIARAIMEAIALRLNEFLKTYARDSKYIRLVGGITKSGVWCRVIAEITGKEVRVVNGEHAGAVGSAIMAGVGAGIYENEKEAFYSIYKEEE